MRPMKERVELLIGVGIAATLDGNLVAIEKLLSH